MRTLICILISLAAAPAWAEWVKLNETNEAINYIDHATISKIGNLRKVWHVQDLKNRDEHGEMSRRALLEFDCMEERFRILSLSVHSELMAEGKLLESLEGPGPWLAVGPPGRPYALISNIACAK